MKTSAGEPADSDRPNLLQPLQVLEWAIKEVPQLRYALGIAGIASVIAIVSLLHISFQIAGFGVIVVLVLMVGLLVFVKLAGMGARHFVLPSLILLWSFLVLSVLAAVFTLTSVFFQFPLSLHRLQPAPDGEAILARIDKLPGKGALKIAYAGTPPIPPSQFERPRLQLDILVKRSIGQLVPLGDGDTLESGVVEFGIVAHSLSAGYLYIFQIDASGHLDWLFPANAESQFSSGLNPVASGQTIQLPSDVGKATKGAQVRSFRIVAGHLAETAKVVSLHSRGAESELLNILREYNIRSAVFHWYSGPLGVLKEAVEAGHYFSFNPAMLVSAKGQEIIRRVPKGRVLTETDGPHVIIAGQPAHPWDVVRVEQYLAILWNVTLVEARRQVWQNFHGLVQLAQPAGHHRIL